MIYKSLYHILMTSLTGKMEWCALILSLGWRQYSHEVHYDYTSVYFYIVQIEYDTIIDGWSQ